MNPNEVAAAIHERMCEDSRFGYSWEERWGNSKETWTVGGSKYGIAVGDYDCASSAITAWKLALSNTGYAGKLDSATYTGNMRQVFVGSGAFEWKPMSFDACPGDLYLNEANHVAMCQQNDSEADVLSEFSISENGTTKGKRGDQTGWESHLCDYYDYPWDGILHYKGATSAKASPSASKPSSKALYGIDVSSNQPANIVSLVDNDFAIVKMSGNPQHDANGKPLKWNYVNEHAAQQAREAMKKHGRLGLYHFAYGKTARVEAEFFVEQVKKLGYIGKAMLVLDYEDKATAKGKSWVRQFCEAVKASAGYPPVIYASGSVIADQGLKALGYPLWCANYSKPGRISGYDTSGCTIYPGCESAILWQFTEDGYLEGYDGGLDLDAFYGEWADYAGGSAFKPKSPEYRVYRDGKWRAWKSDGVSAGVSGTAIYDFDARYLGAKGWFQITLEGGKVLARNAHNDAHAKRVIGVTVYYDTPSDADGLYEAVYRVQTVSGAWLGWEHDDDGGGAGDDRNAVCRVQLKLGRA